MSTGKIEVWITGEGRPCTVSQKEWQVCVYDCCGGNFETPFIWCDQKKCGVTKCGMIDFEVPPGCYFLFATSSGERTGLGVATVGCGQEVCVTLVSLRAHFALATEEDKRWFIEEAEKMKASQSSHPPTP